MVKILDVLNQIKTPEDAQKHSFYGLNAGIKEKMQKDGFETYEGKVRELARKDSSLFIYHTDRLTAFDKYIGMVPYKGMILAEITKFWLEQVEKIHPTHYDKAPHPRVIVGKAATPIKAEVIVRGYLAGSMMRAYEKGERVFCGVQLPEGLKPYQKLPEPIITPTTKAETFEHDEDATAEELIASGVCSQKEWDDISEMALNIFRLGQEIYNSKGWILVDTKYEFGRLPDGKIIIIDEVHTPDSSRLWAIDSYEQRFQSNQAPEMLDKEIVRRYLMDKGYSGEGKVPEVPAENLVSLAKVYLGVCQALIGGDLTLAKDTNETWTP